MANLITRERLKKQIMLYYLVLNDRIESWNNLSNSEKKEILEAARYQTARKNKFFRLLIPLFVAIVLPLSFGVTFIILEQYDLNMTIPGTIIFALVCSVLLLVFNGLSLALLGEETKALLEERALDEYDRKRPTKKADRKPQPR